MAERAFDVLHQRGFGNFDLQFRRRKPGIVQRRADHFGEIPLRELETGSIDGDTRNIKAGFDPSGPLAASGARDPLADLEDLTGLLRDRDKFGGRHVPEFWISPTEQRFEPGKLIASANERLVLEVNSPAASALFNSCSS